MAKGATRSVYERRLVLASASPRRHELLGWLDCSFDVVVSGVDESMVTGPAPELVAELAFRKAQAVSAQESDAACVLGADTVVALSPDDADAILGKPRDNEEAHTMLARLSGSTHWVYTGVAVCRHDVPPNRAVSATEVTFRSLNDSEVARYVATGEPLGKAGAYAIQGAGRELIESIHGCFYNVIGLPLSLTARLLGDEWIGPAARLCDCVTLDLQRGDPRCTER